ncbi:unnamed protein product [Owenia fusiformis]|uniref:Uncharacterized protein n=1 Tax=Owenia fusiformis TaxID=6347 RepID=A0A8J1TCD0_OWEFU|nr:unnamed protein product [Owenia fusiformis]
MLMLRDFKSSTLFEVVVTMAADENSMTGDLYDDLLTASVETRETKHASLEKEVEFLRKENELLNEMSTKLNTEAESIIKNMSSLLQTAKDELSRKNDEIKELKAEVARLKKRSYFEAKRNQVKPNVDIRDIQSSGPSRSHRDRDTKSRSSDRLLGSPGHSDGLLRSHKDRKSKSKSRSSDRESDSPLTTITNGDTMGEIDNVRSDRKRRTDAEENNKAKKARLSISKEETLKDSKYDQSSRRSISIHSRSERDHHRHGEKSRTAKCASDIKNKYRHKNISGNRSKTGTKLDITPRKRQRDYQENRRDISRSSISDLRGSADKQEPSRVNLRDLRLKDEEERKKRKELLILSMSKVFQYGMVAEQRYRDEYDFRRHQHREKHQRRRRTKHKLHDSFDSKLEADKRSNVELETENNANIINEQRSGVSDKNIDIGNDVLDNHKLNEPPHVDGSKADCVSNEPPNIHLTKKEKSASDMLNELQGASDHKTLETHAPSTQFRELNFKSLFKTPNNPKQDGADDNQPNEITDEHSHNITTNNELEYKHEHTLVDNTDAPVEMLYRNDNEEVAFHLSAQSSHVDLAADLEISNITTLSEQEDNDIEDAHEEGDDDLYGEFFSGRDDGENPEVDAAQDESLFDIANDIEPDTKPLPEVDSEVHIINTPQEQNKLVHSSNTEESKCESDDTGGVSGTKDSKNPLSSFMNMWMDRCKAPTSKSSTATSNTEKRQSIKPEDKHMESKSEQTIIEPRNEKAPIDDNVAEVNKEQGEKFPSFLDRILNDCAAGLRTVREHEANNQQNIDPSQMTNMQEIESNILQYPPQDEPASIGIIQSEGNFEKKARKPQLDFNNLPPELVTLVKSVASIPPKARLKALKSLPPDLQAFMEAFEAAQGRDSPLMRMENQLHHVDKSDTPKQQPSYVQKRPQDNEPPRMTARRMSPQMFQATPNMEFPPPSFNPNMITPVGSGVGLCRPIPRPAPVQANLVAVLQHMLLQTQGQQPLGMLPSQSVAQKHHKGESLVKRSKTQKDPRLNKESASNPVCNTTIQDKVQTSKPLKPASRQKIPFAKLRKTPILIPVIQVDPTSETTDPRLAHNTPPLKLRIARSKSLGAESKQEAVVDNTRPGIDLIVLKWSTESRTTVVQQGSSHSMKLDTQKHKAGQTKDMSSTELFNVTKMLEKPKPLAGLGSVTTKLGGFTIPKKKSSKSESDVSFIDTYTLPQEAQMKKKSRETLEKIPGIKIKNKTQVRKEVTPSKDEDTSLEAKVLTFLDTERNNKDKSKHTKPNTISTSGTHRSKKMKNSVKHDKPTISLTEANTLAKKSDTSVPVESNHKTEDTSKKDKVLTHEKHGKKSINPKTKTSKKESSGSLKQVKEKSKPITKGVDSLTEAKQTNEHHLNADRTEKAMNSTVTEHTFGETLISCGGANNKTPVLKVKGEFCDDNDNTMDLAFRIEKLDELYGSTTNTPLKNPNFDSSSSPLNGDDLSQSNDSHTLFIDENASDPAVFDPSENRRGSLTFSSPLKRITPLKTPTKFSVSYAKRKADDEANNVKLDLFSKSGGKDISEGEIKANGITTDVSEIKDSKKSKETIKESKEHQEITRKDTSEKLKKSIKRDKGNTADVSEIKDSKKYKQKLYKESKEQEEITQKDTATTSFKKSGSSEKEKKSRKKDLKHDDNAKVKNVDLKSTKRDEQSRNDKSNESGLKEKNVKEKSSHSKSSVNEIGKRKSSSSSEKYCGNNENSNAVRNVKQNPKDKKLNEKDLQLKIREKNVKDVESIGLKSGGKDDKSNEKLTSSSKKDTKDTNEKLKQNTIKKTKKRKHSESHDQTMSKSQKL